LEWWEFIFHHFYFYLKLWEDYFMSDFSVFMAGTTADESVKYVASKRFAKDGKPVEWELKAVSSDLDESIRKDCTKKVPIAGKRGQYNQETDTDKYIGRLCVATTVYPNLNDAALQDHYGVKSADDLLKKMLLPGEYTEYKAKVMEVNGYDMSMEELVDEAKN
jgi:hypothetical protein